MFSEFVWHSIRFEPSEKAEQIAEMKAKFPDAMQEYEDVIAITMDAEPVASSQCSAGTLTPQTWLRATVRVHENRVSVLHDVGDRIV